MSILMFHEEGGFHQFSEGEVEEAKKNGWVDGAAVRARILAAKTTKLPSFLTPAAAPAVAPEEKPATIETHDQKRRGRPRKEDSVTAER